VIERLKVGLDGLPKLKMQVYDSWFPCLPHQLSVGDRVRVIEGQEVLGTYKVEALPIKKSDGHELLITKEPNEHPIS